MKVLTFVIPAYNSEKFLDICIPSMILPEVMNKVEIIVVNDGSKDNTVNVAEKYCALYPGIVRLISQENKGHGGALNTGCEAATGKYVKVIDSDDWIVTENLPVFLQELEMCNANVVLTHYHTVDIGTGEIKSWKSYPQEFGKEYTFDEIVEHWNDYDRSLTFHGITYNTEFLHRWGYRLSEHVFYEDHEYSTFPCCHADSIKPLDLFIYEYRIGDVEQSVSEVNQLKRIEHTETVLKRMLFEYSQLKTLIESQRQFIRLKIQILLLSYMTTILFLEPNKKEGRRLAKNFLNELKSYAPEIYELVKRKCDCFILMNRCHFSRRTWDSIKSSKLYSLLKRRHTFDS